MKIGITGHEGVVGSELVRRGYGVPIACDITDDDWVRRELGYVRPDVIIHCAAMTNVGECQTDMERAMEVNVRGTSNLMNNFPKGLFIYLSTDHVFEGKRKAIFGWTGYTERHKPSPVNWYGWTKHGGEAIAQTGTCKTIIVRTSKLFTDEMLESDVPALKNNETREFTNLIHRSFLYLPHFIEGLMNVVNRHEEMPNIINVSGKDIWSYYRFWYILATIFGFDTDLVIKRDYEIDDYPRPFKGGLNIRIAQKLGIPTYSATDGLKEIRDEK
jgi:dTDP-4-dehydrorhamnose reductase